MVRRRHARASRRQTPLVGVGHTIYSAGYILQVFRVSARAFHAVIAASSTSPGLNRASPGAVRCRSRWGARRATNGRHVQAPNVRFFQRLGWSVDGDIEDYLGHTHQPMNIALTDT
jgi:hypothetical protein